MKKSVFICLGLLLILLLSGCQGRTKEQAALTDDAHKGVRGATINFIRNNPPDIVFTGTPLDIVVELKNEGASPISGGTLYLSGYDSRLFNIQPKSKQFNLEARTKFNTFGGYETVDFSAGNVFLPQGTETLSQTVIATACYNYRTEARVTVCVDPNPTSVLESEACRPITPAVGGGQGGPVAVSSVRQDSAPGQVGFLITISNQGDGDVVDQYSIGKCPSDLRFNDIDAVYYSASLGGIAGQCQPVTKARLANKQGTIYCTFKLADSSSPAFTSILELNLDYGYLTKKSKTFQIKSIS